MGDDKLPTHLSSNHHGPSDGLSDLSRAKRTRDPISGFFHKIGSRIAKRSIEHITDENRAVEHNIDSQGDVLKAINRLKDTVDDYAAREKLAPEYYQDAVERHEDKLATSSHQRALAAAQRSRELTNASIEATTTRHNLLAAAREAEFQHAASRDGVRNFKQSDAARQQYRDEVLGAKINRARTEREAQSYKAPPAAKTISDADRAYVESLEQLREDAYARGDHEEAARIAQRIAVITGMGL